MEKRERNDCIFLKVDFKRACDRVSWNYLRYMLNRLGFEDK